MMRFIFAAAFVVVSASLSHADDSDAVRLNASELRNVWRTCDVSGRARLAKVHCINEQAQKLVRGKAIQRTNAQSEEVTRQQVGARRP